MVESGDPAAGGPRPHRWLALLPSILLLVGSPLANRVHAYVLGLPFLLFWILCCVLITSLTMAVVEALDRRHERRAPSAIGDRER
jgi:uncharacterized protein DUF3311